MARARCVFAATIEIEAKYEGGVHSHPCTEIIYYLSGTGRLVQEGRDCLYQPGCVSVYQPALEHRDISESAGMQFCVGVTGCGAERLPAEMWNADRAVVQCMENIRREIKRPSGRDNQERLDILAGWLVLELRRTIGRMSKDGVRPDHVNEARKIIDSRFDEMIDLQELAGSLYISPDYLRHIFKQRMGESPLNYLIRRRLDSACELLSTTALPVGEIGRRVGLDNPYYFSRMFRKRLDMSPSEYREQSRKRLGAG